MEEAKNQTWLEISGPPEALAKLLADFKSGKLTEMAGYKILAIDLAPPDALRSCEELITPEDGSR
jgi:hypothetical protein